MTSYEIGSNSSRYPYDYSFVTDGTNGEYTDQTESSFILPTITAADANKFLEVNDTATGYQYTEIEGELPPQAGQTGKFLETNGTSVFWDTVNQVPGITGGVAGQYLTNNGSTASWGVISQVPSQAGNANRLLTTDGTTPSWTDAPVLTSLVTSGNITLSNGNSQFSQLRRNDNVNLVLQDDGSGTRTMTFNIGNLSTTRRRLFIQQGTVTVENSKFVVSDSSQIHSIAGVLNLSTAGSASAPTLMFGDNTDTPVASRTGIWGSDNVIRFGTDGTERVTIRNDGLTVPDGSTAAPSYSFENSTNSGLVRTSVGTDNGIGFVANGTQICSVVGGNFRLSGGASIRNNVSNPSANIQFVGGTGGATGYIQLSFSDSSTGTVATYRLGNGTNWPATETIMSRLVGGTGTNEIFITEHGNTYFRFLGATGTGATLPTRVQRVEINNSGMSVSGDLTVSGTISGNISTPSLVKKVEVVPGGTASAYIYNSSNTSPATLLLSENITENKLVTLDNMGASFDGFEMEYQILGNSNDMQYGVRFTLVQPRGYIFPRDGRPVIKNTTANYTTATDNLFQNITNNFRVRATFVWAGSAANCYWIVRDITEYGRIVAGRFTSTGDYTINLNSPRYLILNRNTSTRNIIFPDLKQSSSWLGEAGGFEMRIVSYIFGGTGPDITFTNGATAGSGTQMVVIGSGAAENKAPGESITAFSGSLARQYDCVFTELIGGQFGWLLTRYGG